MDMVLPERISDFAYFLRGDYIDARYHYEFEGEIICAVPIDCFGLYEQFYSKTAPETGIQILRKGLAISPHKSCIAQDLGYILRDERRFREAAEMFKIAVDEGPSSNFICAELIDCYREIGNLEMAAKYQELHNKGHNLRWRGGPS